MDMDAILRALVLWRHQPELTEHLRAHAEAGNTDAQYALGLLYAEGRGMPYDPARAYQWLTLAAERGDADALTLRHIVVGDMTAQQIEEGEQRAAAWQRRHQSASRQV